MTFACCLCISLYSLLILCIISTADGIQDLHILSDPLGTRYEQTHACQQLGYDGLALLKTPEEYSQAIKLSQTVSNTNGIYIGMLLVEEPLSVLWDDGSTVAPDVPWSGSAEEQILPGRTYIRITKQGKLRTRGDETARMGLCGNHNQSSHRSVDITGSTIYDKVPLDNVTHLSTFSNIRSYVCCVALCGQQDLCRAATFQTDHFTCKTFGPGDFSDSYLTQDSAVKLFVRNSFWEYI